MMKRITLTLISALIFGTGYGQPMPTKNEQYDFLEWYINTNKPRQVALRPEKFENFGFKMSDLENLPLKDRIVTDEDIAFMKRQIIEISNINKLDTVLLKFNDWKKREDKDLPITFISMPVFSKDGKFAFINRSYICGGLCGEGGMEVYIVDKKGKWARYTGIPLPQWVS